MHKCIVCGNTKNNTKGVLYHGEEHIGSAVENNFKSPRRSSRLARNNKDAVVNDFKSPRRSSRLARNNKDAVVNDFKSPRRSSRLARNNKNMDIINTKNIPSTSSCVNRWDFCSNEKPSSSSSNHVANVESNITRILLTIDSTNRNAKDLAKRKMLIEKYGMEKDHAELVSNTRVSITDFELYCFETTELNGLTPGAVPFIQNDIINKKNIPSTSSRMCIKTGAVKRGSVPDLKILRTGALPIKRNDILNTLNFPSTSSRVYVEKEAARSSTTLRPGALQIKPNDILNTLNFPSTSSRVYVEKEAARSSTTLRPGALQIKPNDILNTLNFPSTSSRVYVEKEAARSSTTLRPGALQIKPNEH